MKKTELKWFGTISRAALVLMSVAALGLGAVSCGGSDPS